MFPVLVCACLSVLDIRILIVLLMVVFVLIPFAMVIIYSYYMLSDAMVWSISQKTITVESDGTLFLEFENEKLRPKRLGKDCVHRLLYHKTYLLLQVESPKYRFLILPESAFRSEEQKEQFIKIYV